MSIDRNKSTLSKDSASIDSGDKHSEYADNDTKRKFSTISTKFINGMELVLIILCGLAFAKYMQELHETKLWFTNIKPVEREISLRTESGLYYSYYKFAASNLTLKTVLTSLMNDTRTEYPHSINILQRFNIYQEIMLAVFYKFLSQYSWFCNLSLDPILFYVYSCFLVVGIGLIALQLLAVKLSQIRFVGILVFAWAVVNLDDFTRAFFTVNLRENFALPFLWIQNLCVVSGIQGEANFARLNYFIFTTSTFLFTIFWQFSQFILIQQSITLFLLVPLIPKQIKNVKIFLFLQFLAYSCAILVHFLQPMMIASAFVSFTLAAFIILSILTFFHGNHPQRLTIACKFWMTFGVIVISFLLIYLLRRISGIQSDNHIWSFIKAKIGLIDRHHIPFDTALYTCHDSFKFIGFEFFERTTKIGCLPLYLISIFILSMDFIFFHIRGFRKKSFHESKLFDEPSPAVLYYVTQSLMSGLIAILTLRMKYLWFPQMIVIGGCFFSRAVKLIGYYTSHILAFSVAIALLVNHYPTYKKELANEQEFYDPDTVELMEWISSSTPTNSSWSGSMQLMAGIKACTSRNIANHPHFEDKQLRERTLRLYQIYGRKSLAEVNKILVDEKVNYIILEDSICLAHSSGCSTKDLVDTANGHPTDQDILQYDRDDERTAGERFCNRIRRMDEEALKYFKLVFANRTFRIYYVVI